MTPKELARGHLAELQLWSIERLIDPHHYTVTLNSKPYAL